MWRLAAKRTYIGQLEICAFVVAYLTFPDLLRGRLVHHFVDNESAIGALIAGGSPQPDSNVLVGLAHEELLRLVCRPWIGFVYSEDNWSDEPSRDKFDSLRAAGARFRECRWPSRTKVHARTEGRVGHGL